MPAISASNSDRKLDFVLALAAGNYVTPDQWRAPIAILHNEFLERSRPCHGAPVGTLRGPTAMTLNK